MSEHYIMVLFRTQRDRALPRVRTLLHFLGSQGVSIASNLLYGFVCVRMLGVLDYSKFIILFGFLGTLTNLLDIGVTATFAPLIGPNTDDRYLIADYLASLRSIALRLYFIIAPAAIVGFVVIVKKQNWNYSTIAVMTIILLAAGWFARVSSSYGAVLLVTRDRTHYYRQQIIGSAGSLLLLLVFVLSRHLTLYVAVVLNLGQISYMAFVYYRRARHLLQTPGISSRTKERAIIRLALPNLPSTLFYAVQGQVALVIITLVGRSAMKVASMGALGRLGQIFLLFAQIGPILVEPYFARLPAERVRRLYMIVVSVVVVFAASVTGVAFLFPGLLLWILGPNYSTLRLETGLVVASAAIRFVAGFIWSANVARRFVYWWNTTLIIVVIILIQGAFLWAIDLSSLRAILKMNIAVAFAELLVVISSSVYGFLRGPQSIPSD